MSGFLDRVKLQTKLQVAVMAIVFFAVALSAGLSAYAIYSKARELGRSLAETAATGAVDVLALHHKSSAYRLKAVMDALESMVDAQTFGPGYDKNFAITDKMRERYDTSATLFALTPQGFVRVSTNITQDGKRIVGTLLDNGPVVEALKAGRSYEGAASVGGMMRVVEYRPVKKDGQVVGAIFAGKRLLTD